MVSYHLLLILSFTFAPSFIFFSADANFEDCREPGISLFRNGNLASCTRLEVLDAEFGWRYNNVTQKNGTWEEADIYFAAKPPLNGGWMAWGVNPGKKPEMVGTRAVIAFRAQNGSIQVLPFNVTAQTKRHCPFHSTENGLSIVVRNASVGNDKLLSMFLTIRFPGYYNLSRLNVVWQVGPNVSPDGQPSMHGVEIPDFESRATFDIKAGQYYRSWHRREHLREAHGIMMIAGWGTITPIGIICARYFKKFPFEYHPLYRLHVPSQMFAYVIGTVSWSIGLSLGYNSKRYTFRTHRIIGITIFSAATLQVLAFWLRPKKTDQYRQCWNIYHHFLGYSIFSLVAVNIFQGIHILRPSPNWRWAYIGILSGLGLIVLILEIITWIKFIYNKVSKKARSS